MNFNRYQLAVAVLAVMIFFTNFDLYLFSTGIISFTPLHWIIAFGIISLPIFLSARNVMIVLKSPAIIWLPSYIIVSAIWFLAFGQSGIAWQELRTRLLSSLFILMMMFLFSAERAQFRGRQAILMAVLMAVAFNIYEFFHPLAFSDIPGRSAGLYINPNISGAACILGMITSIEVVEKRYRGPFVLFVGVGVCLTFSRGGILLWLVVVVLMLIIGTIHLRRLVLTMMLAVVVVTMVMLSNLDLVAPLFDRFGALDQNVLNRIVWLKNPSFSSSDYWERLGAAEHAWQMFLDSPFLGNGTGASKEWNPLGLSSHNMFLNLMADHGVFGLFVLPLLVLAATWRAAGESRHTAIIFSVFIFLWSLISHNVLEERYSILSFALIIAMVTRSRMEQGRGEVDKVKAVAFKNYR
jgi:hypothetical protein